VLAGGRNGGGFPVNISAMEILLPLSLSLSLCNFCSPEAEQNDKRPEYTGIPK
jgi:hypothetical protein